MGYDWGDILVIEVWCDLLSRDVICWFVIGRDFLYVYWGMDWVVEVKYFVVNVRFVEFWCDGSLVIWVVNEYV